MAALRMPHPIEHHPVLARTITEFSATSATPTVVTPPLSNERAPAVKPAFARRSEA